ncbi:MAG TPA: hypothetical protein VFZ26_19035 [Gemmatimonadales bacterium]
MRPFSARALAANLALLAGALVATLLLVEGGLRLFGLASPVLYRLDPVIGYEPRPSQVSFRLGVKVHINDVGLRDDEDLATLMDSRERILVVGNSVTYGSSLVSQDELFTEVLERYLRPRRPGVKVLNGGVAGYSVTQIVRRAPRLVRQTDPDYLVLYLIREDFNRHPVRYPHEDSSQEPQRRPPLALVTFLRLSTAFVDGRYRLRERFPALDLLWPPGAPPPRVPPYDRSRVMDLHFEAIEEFLRTEWDPSGRSRSNVIAFISPTRGDIVEDRRQRNDELVRRLEALGVGAHNLQPDFRAAMSPDGLDPAEYYHDQIHYRPRGNDVAGRVVGEYLMRHLRPAPGAGPRDGLRSP